MKKLFAVVMVIITMFAFVGCGGASGKDGKSAMSPEQAEKNSIRIIQEAMECSEETAKKHYGALKSVGLVPIEKLNFMADNVSDFGSFGWPKFDYKDSLSCWYLVKGGTGGNYAVILVEEKQNEQNILFIHCETALLYVWGGDGSAPKVVKNISDAKINQEQVDKLIVTAHSAIRKSLNGRVIKFRPYKNGIYNGMYKVGKSNSEKFSKAPFSVSGEAEMLDEQGRFVFCSYTVRMDNDYKVKQIKVSQYKIEQLYNGTRQRYIPIVEINNN